MLNATNLSVRFGPNTLFQDVSIAVRPGELWQVRGDNGAGKTTLLRVLADLLEPTTGTVEYKFAETDKGQGSSDEQTSHHHYIEYLASETNSLFGKLPAADNLQFWSELRRGPMAIEDISRTLHEWDLKGEYLIRRLPVMRYSTGMKRRLALCRLVLSQTRLWLLDEPISGLDERARGRLRQSMADHLGRGGAIVLISHDLEAVRDLPAKDLVLRRPGVLA